MTPGTGDPPGRPKRQTRPKPRAGRESAAARGARTLTILRRLKRAYPDARCALDHGDAYQLLAATILSAQCTDVRVNMV
ncbi:MAG: endonuclease III, partial [Gemmatimonadota bacterium]